MTNEVTNEITNEMMNDRFRKRQGGGDTNAHHVVVRTLIANYPIPTRLDILIKPLNSIEPVTLNEVIQPGEVALL